MAGRVEGQEDKQDDDQQQQQGQNPEGPATSVNFVLELFFRLHGNSENLSMATNESIFKTTKNL